MGRAFDAIVRGAELKATTDHIVAMARCSVSDEAQDGLCELLGGCHSHSRG